MSQEEGWVLRYVELKSGYSDNGPAWVARVKMSRSGQTVYFGNKALSRGNGVSGNYYDVETGEEYWVSGVKKRGLNRHWAGGGSVAIEASAVVAFLEHTGREHVDPKSFVVVPDLPSPNPARFVALLNEKVKSRL